MDGPGRGCKDGADLEAEGLRGDGEKHCGEKGRENAGGNSGIAPWEMADVNKF